jgi:hypothetical protein
MTSWTWDVQALCRLYGATADKIREMPAETLREFWRFRVRCQEEEIRELVAAKTAEDAVDALVDGIVFAIGTLQSFGVDADEAWRRVHAANMGKVRGEKAERKNRFGFPDLVKPDGWKAPDHSGNVGLLEEVFRGRSVQDIPG